MTSDSTHVRTLTKLLTTERAKLKRQLAAVNNTEREIDLLGELAPPAVFTRLSNKLDRQRSNMEITMRYVETIESELHKIASEND